VASRRTLQRRMISGFVHPSSSLPQTQTQMPIKSFSTKAMPLEDFSHIYDDRLSYYYHTALKMATNDDELDGPPPNRNADEYDDLFFVPATTPTSQGSPSQSQFRPSYDADNDSDYNYNEKSGAGNFFDDDYVQHDREELRSSQPTKPSTQQQYVPNQRNSYRATGDRQQQQYSQQFQSGGIPSTRALYQFRPIQSGSTRQMPPTVSYYDSYGDDYNVEEDQESYTNFDEQNNNAVFVDDADEPVVKRSAKIITKDTDKEVVVNKQVSVQSQDPKPASQNEAESKHVSLDITSKVSAAAANTSQTYPSRTPRNFSPSFMEPPKVKVINNDNTDNADNNTPRKIPVEASTGNVSTQYIDTLTQQLEHLSAQIYELNDGIEFNIGSPKQVAKVLFGEDDQGSSTNKDVLEAMVSAGNIMAENIYKWRKVSSQKKRELKRIEQMEKGDRKNDYYGNLARRDTRQNNSVDTKESTQRTDQVNFFETIEEDDEQDEASPVKETVSNRETLLLIDASAYIFRSYHAMPPLHRADGLPTGALHGVCRLLQSLLLSQLLKGDRPRVVLAFDSKGDNFRHELYPEYKANRGPCPEDLIPQFDLVKEAASAFGILQVEAKGYEADDVIATLSRMALDVGMNVDIMSGDKDLWQLVTPPNADPRLYMVDPLNFSAISHDDVVQKWGVSADKLADLLALAGDASDNIKGAPGIGPKIAAQLLNEYGSLSDLFANTDKIKQKKRRESLDASVEEVMLFRQLVALDDTIPVERMTMSSQSFQCVSSVRMPIFDPSKLLDFYERMELKTCKNDLERRLRSSWVHYKQPPSPAEFSDVPF
jgi:5'-3' exonuclease